jgi:hypothetical protein
MTSTQQLNGGTSTAPYGMNLLTFYRIVGINEPNSYTWTFANSSNSGGTAVGGFLAFSGVDTTSSPINVWSAQLNPSSLVQSTASITPTVPNTTIVSSLAYLSASSFLAPTGISGVVERLDQSAPLVANSVGTTIQMSTATQTTATATGSVSATATGDSSYADYGIGHLMALKPAQVDTAIAMVRSGNLIVGSSASYALTVSNYGYQTEPGPLTVIDTLPTGLTYAAYSGGGWSCSASGQVVTCTRTGALTSGGSVPTLTINVNVAANASGTVINTATVSGTGGDENSANNTASDTYVFPAVAYAYYPMEESAWGVITDYSGNGYNASALGSASPTNGPILTLPYSAIPGNPGTCGAGQIPNGATAIGVNTAIDVNSIGNTGTIMFWYSDNENWNNGTNRILFDASNVVGSSANHFFLVKDSNGALTFSMEDSAGHDSTATSPGYNFSANQWHHIAVTWDLSVNQTAIYLDGNTVAIATSNTALNGSLGDMSTLYLGAQRMAGVTGVSASYTNNTADGYIDEVRLFQGALSATAVSSWYTQTHACAQSVASVTPPFGFNCVETGLSALSGHLYTKTVNSPFAVDVVALTDTNNDGVADSVYTNYASNGNKTVTVELVNGGGSTSCAQRTALSPAVTQSLTFTQSGQLTAQGRMRSALMSVANAYSNLMCRVTDANQTPVVVGCSTDSFAVRPTGFTVSSNVNADATGTNATATPTLKAGASFTLTAAGNASGYSGTPNVDSTKIAVPSVAIAAGSVSGGFNAADSGTGIATGSAFAYSEVGYFNFSANGIYDSTFTAVDSAVGDCTNDFSNTAVNNQYGCSFGNTTTSAYYGRFIPDHFDVSLNSPVFAPTCGTLTYMGQPIKYTANPVATVVAKNLMGSTTQNYTGSYFKINPSSTSYGITPSYAEASQALTVYNNSAPNVADLGQTLGANNYGAGTLTFADTTYNVIAVTRPTIPTSPVNANIALSFNLIDGDGVYVANVNGTTINNSNSLVSFGSASAGNGISFTNGYNNQLWGRLTLTNANGTELTPLIIPVTAQYFNGFSFVPNASDNCTNLNLSNQIYLSNSATSGGSTQSGTTAMTLGLGSSTASLLASTLVSGAGGISFSSPGAGNTGSISINSNFSNTLPWLAYPWNQGNTQDAQSPSALVTFGVYQGSPKIIYLHEVY